VSGGVLTRAVAYQLSLNNRLTRAGVEILFHALHLPLTAKAIAICGQVFYTIDHYARSRAAVVLRNGEFGIADPAPVPSL
jgi:hypothetical protein